MYRFQDYYAEECDPYYEECPAATQPDTIKIQTDQVCMSPFNKDVYIDQDGNLEEYTKENIVDPLVYVYGAVPFLTLTAGYWNFNEWGTFETDWDAVWVAQLASGTASLVNWGGALLVGDPFSGVFYWTHKVNILAEVALLYFSYDASSTYASSGNSTRYSYFAHFVSLVVSGVSFKPIDFEYKPMTQEQIDARERAATYKPPTEAEIKAHVVCIGCSKGYEEYCDEIETDKLYLPSTDEETDKRQYLCQNQQKEFCLINGTAVS